MVEESRGGFVYKGLGKVPDRALLLFAALMYLFLYAPILMLVIFSFNSSRSTQVWTGFSTEWYGELLRDQTILDAFRTSMIVGVTATAIATVIGTLTALALTRYRFRGKTFADSTIYAATVMPEIVVGVSLLVFFVAASLQLGITTIIIAHVAFTISFVTIVVRARLSGMDQSIEEAAQDLYASPMQTFWKVTFPILLPAIFSGLLLAFALAALWLARTRRDVVLRGRLFALLGGSTALGDHLGQARAVHVLHHQVRLLVVGVGVEHLGGAERRHLAHPVDLAAEPAAELLVGRQVGAHHLHRDQRAGRVPGQVHGAHAARSDLTLDTEPAGDKLRNVHS